MKLNKSILNINHSGSFIKTLLLFLIIVSIIPSCQQRQETRNQEEGTTEWIKFNSKETGREVWQITTDSSINIACYFERQAFTSDDRYLVFSSMREGKWRLFRANLENGKIIPLSPESRVIEDYDYTIHPDGKQACYIDGNILYGINVSSLKETVLFDFSGHFTGRIIFSGSFTSDGKHTLVSVRNEPVYQLYRVNLESGEVLLVHEQNAGEFSHPQINPANPDIISYCPLPDTQNDMSLPMEQRARTWKIDVSKGTDEPYLICPYGFRATHESWSADGSRLFYFRKTQPGWKPATICSISVNGDDVREHYTSDTIRLGHGISSQDGKWFISDSQDKGRNPLILLNLVTGSTTFLNWPDASVKRADHTHVHPFFSNSGKFVCYTSDVTGIPQVYVVPVGDITYQAIESN